MTPAPTPTPSSSSTHPPPSPIPTPSPSLPLKSWPYSRTFRIQYGELDLLNHLNHAVYFRFMETLRTEYYLELRRATDPHELDIIIAEARCRYLAPVRFATNLVGEVAPAYPLGRTSFSLLYRFTDEAEGIVTARGLTAIVQYDYSTGTKKPIRSEVRSALERDAVDPKDEGW